MSSLKHPFALPSGSLIRPWEQSKTVASMAATILVPLSRSMPAAFQLICTEPPLMRLTPEERLSR